MPTLTVLPLLLLLPHPAKPITAMQAKATPNHLNRFFMTISPLLIQTKRLPHFIEVREPTVPF